MPKTNEELIDHMFPFYEDMSDIELIQTVSRRVGADKMAEFKDEQFEKEKHELIERANESVTQSFENGAKWAEQRVIKKAADFTYKVLVGCGWLTSYQCNDFIKELKKAMEDEI